MDSKREAKINKDKQITLEREVEAGRPHEAFDILQTLVMHLER